MIMILNSLRTVGPKFLLFIGLVAFVIFCGTWIREDTKTDFIKDQKIEQIQREVEIRKKVDGLLEENRKANPNRDGAIALDRLRQRYENVQ